MAALGLCLSGAAPRAEARSLEAAAAAAPDVIVIGAGMSGIAAARNLAKKGLKVVVVEGRNRLGGRLHTEAVKVGGKSVNIDLGGAWIHGGAGGGWRGCRQGRAATGSREPLVLRRGGCWRSTATTDHSRPSAPARPPGLKNNPLVQLAKDAGVALPSRVTEYENDVLYRGATAQEVPDAKAEA